MKNYLVELTVSQLTELPAYVIVCTDKPINTEYMAAQCAQAFITSEYDEETETFAHYNDMHVINVYPAKVTTISDDEFDIFTLLTNCRVYHDVVDGVDEEQVKRYMSK